MKKIFLVSLLGCFTLLGYSQQYGLYSLNFENRFLYNPARTGFNGNAELNLMYRKQWVDFKGAPETRAASFNMAVGKGGFGFYVYNDVSDVFKTWGGSFNYAYHLQFGKMHRLSIGLSAGIQDYGFDRSKANVISEFDPLLLGDRGATFDGSAGLNYFLTGKSVTKSKEVAVKSKGDSLSVVTDAKPAKTKKKTFSLLNLSIGISAISLLSTDLKFTNDSTASTAPIPGRHFMGILSNEFKLINEKLILEPMVITRFTQALNYQIDAGMKIGYMDRVWVSGMYRYDYGVTISGGVKVHDAISIAYAYDLATNDIKNYQNGTHEIMLGFTFGKKKDDFPSKEEFDDLKAQVEVQDSLLSDLFADHDSLTQMVDSLTNDIDSLKRMLETGAFEFGSGGDSLSAGKTAELHALEDRIRDLEAQIDETLVQLDIRAKDIENEMTEERTRIVSEEDLELKRGSSIGDYFMVVGSFRIEENSYNFFDDLKRRGYEAGVVYDKKRKWYYAFIAQPTDLKKGLEDLYKLREENPEFHDAWIHIMKKSMK